MSNSEIATRITLIHNTTMTNRIRGVISTKVIAPLLPIEETALTGFTLTQWLEQHPCNAEVVKEMAAKITKYVRST